MSISFKAIIQNQADNTYISFLLAVIVWNDFIFVFFSELKVWMEDNFTSLKELFDETSR